MFDLLGIDWGTKCIGFALANSSTKLIIPHSSTNLKTFYFSLQEILGKYPITKIVVGRPVNFQLQPTEVTTKVELFAAELQNKLPNIGVVFVNERNSSKDGLHGLTSAKSLASNSIHSLSAAKILEYYLG